MSQSRQELIAEFAQSYRSTAQLLYKSIRESLHDQPDHNQSYWHVMKILEHHGELSQHAIAQHLHHSDAAISRQIVLLQEKEYVMVNADAANKRICMVKLTKQGRATLRQLEAVIDAHLMEILADLPDDRLKVIISTNNELQNILINN